MDKIINQNFNLSVKKSDVSKSDDALGALFSLPLLIEEKKDLKKTTDEFTVNPSIDKILSSKKTSKLYGKLDIMYSEFFSRIPKKYSNNSIFKSSQVFEFNSDKIPNILKVDVKLNKIVKDNLAKKKVISKLNSSDVKKELNLKINTKGKNESGFPKGSDELKIALNSNKLIHNNDIKKNYDYNEKLNDIFSKIDYLKDDLNSKNFDNKIVINDSEITYKKLKANDVSNNFFNNSDYLNKVDNFNLRNNFSHHQLNSDKNMHFVLDQLTEELDMSKLGWTEKLILRIEKGLKEDEKQIELSLKPRQLGNLKINLKLKDKGANIIMKVENTATMVALQSNEALLSKILLDQGFILEKVNFENSLMDSNKNGYNSPQNNKGNNYLEDEVTLLNDEENNKDDNLNYIININA